MVSVWALLFSVGTPTLRDGMDAEWIELSSWNRARMVTSVANKEFAIWDAEIDELLARYERDVANRRLFESTAARLIDMELMENWISLKY